MRRTEFDNSAGETLAELAESVSVGYLAIARADMAPRIVPLHFIWHSGRIWFHGAGAGEKAGIAAVGTSASFSVDKMYSQIPSYWLARDYACPATTLFSSAFIEGSLSIVADIARRAEILDRFMRKYQPEGGYRPITIADPLYRKALEETCVYSLSADRVSVKDKFLQNRPPSQREKIIRQLEERAAGADLATAARIRQFLENGARESADEI